MSGSVCLAPQNVRSSSRPSPIHGRACLGYCFFFFGVIETSNIVLTVVDIFKMFPALEKRFHGAYVAVRGLFALVYVVRPSG